MHRFIAVGRYFVAFALAACSTYGPTAATHAGSAQRDGAATQRSNSDNAPAATGGTFGTGGSGSAAGQPAPSGPGEKEHQRGNTPPGVDRDGHGPAAGAIVDPAGVTTKGR